VERFGDIVTVNREVHALTGGVITPGVSLGTLFSNEVTGTTH
jgi:hypothetical protein